MVFHFGTDGDLLIVTWDYRVLLVCPHLDYRKWVLKENLPLSLSEVLNTKWEFNCPRHGPQREKPLQAEEKKEPLGD